MKKRREGESLQERPNRRVSFGSLRVSVQHRITSSGVPSTRNGRLHSHRPLPHQHAQTGIGQGSRRADFAREPVQHHRKRFLPTHQSCASLFPSLTADERKWRSHHRPCRLRERSQSREMEGIPYQVARGSSCQCYG